MANIDFTITITDLQAARVQAAYGKWVAPTVTGSDGLPHPTGPAVWTPATAAQMRTIVKQMWQQQVRTYESGLVAQAKSDSVSAEVW